MNKISRPAAALQIFAIAIVFGGFISSASGQFNIDGNAAKSASDGPGTNMAILPQEVSRLLEKQRAAMKMLYVEYSDTLFRSNRIFTNKTTAYFQGNRFTASNDEREYSFDGKNAWIGGRAVYMGRSPFSLEKFLPGDSSDKELTYLYWKLSYFNAAGIYAPAFLTEVNDFSSLEPLVLHYAANSDATTVRREGDNFSITMHTDDDYLNNERKRDLVHYRKLLDNGANPPEYINKALANVRRLQAMVPKRTVSMLLDSQHGYSVAERKEWTAAGQLIACFQADNWKFYENAGIWLPGRCVVINYATPYTFEVFSDQPLQTNVFELTRAEFGERNEKFVFSEKSKYKQSGTQIADRTLPEARDRGNGLVVFTVGASGDLLRASASLAAHEANPVRRTIIICILLVLGTAPLAAFIIRNARKRKKD